MIMSPLLKTTKTPLKAIHNSYGEVETTGKVRLSHPTQTHRDAHPPQDVTPSSYQLTPNKRLPISRYQLGLLSRSSKASAACSPPSPGTTSPSWSPSSSPSAAPSSSSVDYSTGCPSPTHPPSSRTNPALPAASQLSSAAHSSRSAPSFS